jgi:hypothetical protein
VRPLFALAGACALIGLFPLLALPPAVRVGALVAGVPLSATEVRSLAHAAPVTVFMLSVAAGALLLWAVTRRASARRRAEAAWTWGCGFVAPDARMQYTASSFAAPLLAPFQMVSGMHIERAPGAFASHAGDLVLDRLLLPAWRRIRVAAALLRPLQTPRLSVRLVYMQAILVALLIYLLLGGSQ